MRFLDLFIRRDSDAAQQAKDRLQIIVARERTSTSDRNVQSYLPQLQQELLAVIARYEKIDLSNVTVSLDRHGGSEVLELNITLPEGQPPRPGSPRPSFA